MKPWTKTHQREAYAAGCRALAVVALEVGASEAWARPAGLLGDVNAEVWFRAWLSRAVGFDTARVDREVRRVRALAEKRLVREVVWIARTASGATTMPACATPEEAKFIRRQYPATRIVRVTRIRRA